MYYEEKIINGNLVCRYKPDGKWLPCSGPIYKERYLEVLEALKAAKEYIETFEDEKEQPRKVWDTRVSYKMSIKSLEHLL